jgi:hypothetical protein
LLREIRPIFNQQDEGAKALSSAELTTQLMGSEGFSWTNLSGQYGDELKVNKLTKMLNPLEIKTKQVRCWKNTPWGYKFPDFGDAVDRDTCQKIMEAMMTLNGVMLLVISMRFMMVNCTRYSFP